MNVNRLTPEQIVNSHFLWKLVILMFVVVAYPLLWDTDSLIRLGVGFTGGCIFQYWLIVRKRKRN
jgi:hypothetical protein